MWRMFLKEEEEEEEESVLHLLICFSYFFGAEFGIVFHE